MRLRVMIGGVFFGRDRCRLNCLVKMNGDSKMGSCEDDAEGGERGVL
jgi:hypothetical protein